jgi:hypothetical protein
MKPKFVFRIFANMAPTTGRVRGYRIQVAHANMEGKAFGKPCPSFAKRFLVATSGDYGSAYAAGQQVDKFLSNPSGPFKFLKIHPDEVIPANLYF